MFQKHMLIAGLSCFTAEMVTYGLLDSKLHMGCYVWVVAQVGFGLLCMGCCIGQIWIVRYAANLLQDYPAVGDVKTELRNSLIFKSVFGGDFIWASIKSVQES